MSDLLCDQCGGPVTFARGDKRGEHFVPGDYFMVGVHRLGGGYGKACAWQSVAVHIACLEAWRAANGGNGSGPARADRA